MTTIQEKAGATGAPEFVEAAPQKKKPQKSTLPVKGTASNKLFFSPKVFEYLSPNKVDTAKTGFITAGLPIFDAERQPEEKTKETKLDIKNPGKLNSKAATLFLYMAGYAERFSDVIDTKDAYYVEATIDDMELLYSTLVSEEDRKPAALSTYKGLTAGLKVEFHQQVYHIIRHMTATVTGRVKDGDGFAVLIYGANFPRGEGRLVIRIHPALARFLTGARRYWFYIAKNTGHFTQYETAEFQIWLYLQIDSMRNAKPGSREHLTIGDLLNHVADIIHHGILNAEKKSKYIPRLIIDRLFKCLNNLASKGLIEYKIYPTAQHEKPITVDEAKMVFKDRGADAFLRLHLWYKVLFTDAPSKKQLQDRAAAERAKLEEDYKKAVVNEDKRKMRAEKKRKEDAKRKKENSPPVTISAVFNDTPPDDEAAPE